MTKSLKVLPLLFLLVTLFCSGEKTSKIPETLKPPIPEYIGKLANKTPGTFRLAFGSCSKITLPQPIWRPIINSEPDLWLWLGDIIYADTEDMSEMRRQYDTQKSQPDYAELRKKVPIIGVWDDHDYGLNDGGKEYTKREESQKELLDFLGETPDSPRRKQKGAYWSYTYGEGERQLKVLLLDTRYHRDTPSQDGDVLGEEQWAWLENELKSSTAAVNIIASSIQVIAQEQRFEKWENFPKARKKLFETIKNSGAEGVIIISGDRHIAELSKVEDSSVSYPIYDLTSSGMTHVSNEPEHYPWTEPNRYRIGKQFRELNFGIVDIDWNAAKVSLIVCGPEGVAIKEDIELSKLK
ncbi:MAG: alkaline phosphatase family protein [Blastocatellia bacterium]|nr:alkaline phosphatase family protein [Blastocatellia bacterium]